MLGAKQIIVAVIIFLIGFSIGNSLGIDNKQEEMPLETTSYTTITPEKDPYELILEKLSRQPKSTASPQDRIKEESIYIYNRRIIINIDNPIVARFTDTKSMEPLLNKDSNAIEITPKTEDEIKIGDIISYESNQGTIIHRVIDKGEDEEGTYFITKGDNLGYSDPEKVRFDHIKRVVVGILY